MHVKKDFLGMNNAAAYKMWYVVFNPGAGKKIKICLKLIGS